MILNPESEDNYDVVNISQEILPAKIRIHDLGIIMESAKLKQSPVLAVVVGTKPDFYKQASTADTRSHKTGRTHYDN